jgi:hypothetical protein
LSNGAYGKNNQKKIKRRIFMGEDEVKKIIAKYYEDRGYSTEVAWDHKHGIDIVAKKEGEERIIIEVKGCGSRPQMRVNYFLSILGEILQRMDDAQAKYYIALPKMDQYINLWDRLPELAKRRTEVGLILVDTAGSVEFR